MHLLLLKSSLCVSVILITIDLTQAHPTSPQSESLHLREKEEGGRVRNNINIEGGKNAGQRMKRHISDGSIRGGNVGASLPPTSSSNEILSKGALTSEKERIEKVASKKDDAVNNGSNRVANKKKIQQKLLVMMIDAFRYDYFLRSELVGFRTLLSRGSRSRFVEPAFPSKTYPNMFTQVTGVYTENHGVVDNNIYDPDHHMIFYASGHSNTTIPVDEEGINPFWWNQSEPIWISAEQAGLRGGVYYWEGCQVEISKTNVTFCQPYKSLMGMPEGEYEALYDSIIRDTILNFKNNSWDLGMIYYELVDAYGHSYGLKSPEFQRALMITDNIILKLLAQIDLNGLRDSVNVILVSDHGMDFWYENTTENWILLDKYLCCRDNYDPFTGSGPVVQLHPKSREIYQETVKNLTGVPGIKVYTKEDENFPERLHMAKNNRTAPIIIVADRNRCINDFSSPFILRGQHGYDPQHYKEMRAIFAATGPFFKKSFVSKSSMIMVDHYNVFCAVLDINHFCHPNNGSWTRVMDMFADDAFNVDAQGITKPSASSYATILQGSTILLTLTTVVFIDYL